ncbi:TELOMERIC REPEAT BINDING PROTEIN [Salix koriyanagi]|uniref:TELOMERIC REPEAT BINDING PROTEIN n=1 Tax=Salix koriyanagi TaxID=2511006 RepID=A0A9Q0TQD9_9ROSI|nr:TELOMERIC REPEAT BINDING PROTEIN [Salix koriyanagi]
MVLQKRLDYGFNGYQVPPVPRATRSARRRGSFKKKHEENQICAFDLLAIVAGKLLLDKKKLLPVLVIHQRTKINVQLLIVLSKESLVTQNDLNLGLASALTKPDCAERSNAERLVSGQTKNEIGTFASKAEGDSSEYREFGDCKSEAATKRAVKDEPHKSGMVQSSTVVNMCNLEDPVVLDAKPPALVSSDSRAKVPACGNHISNSSYPTNQDDLHVVSRDDDENSSGCTHPITTKKFFRPAPRIGDRRIRKFLASKCWKVAPRLKDATVSNSDGNFKPVFRKRQNCYRHQRSERIYPFKKRKHFAYSSPSNSDGGMSCEFVSDLSLKGSNGDASVSRSRMHGATGASSSFAGQRTSFLPRDSHVKLRIKSFSVPEFLIEIPESSTVGSLKRTVMEAVTAILGSGLHVGVLLQGKKVREDNKTLRQTGISHNNQLDALGFCLEPNPSQTPPSLSPGDSPFLLQCDTPQPIRRYPPTTGEVHQDICADPEPHVNNLGNYIESDHDSAPSPTDTSMDKSTNSKALVAVPAMNVEALAVVPAHQKSKRSEIAQRRIRRPFSVTEVEALVHAVEKLGTGRWRDVKLQAFDNAKHRTYVDLKDKWKTLVHTARISPQQRRGAPVPQELLDRVLTAHAYWSQQQAKQQFKHQQAETCLLL